MLSDAGRCSSHNRPAPPGGTRILPRVVIVPAAPAPSARRASLRAAWSIPAGVTPPPLANRGLGSGGAYGSRLDLVDQLRLEQLHELQLVTITLPQGCRADQLGQFADLARPREGCDELRGQIEMVLAGPVLASASPHQPRQ